MSFVSKFRRGNKLLAIVSLVALVSVAIPVYLNFVRPSRIAHAGWFNDNWNYRRPVTITKTTEVSNQTVNVNAIDTATLVTEGKMQSDCGDSIWTDADGKIMPYSIVSGCNSSNTTYSMIVPTIYNGDTRLYLYYGNPSSQNMFQTTLDAAACSGCTSALGTAETGPGPVLWLKFNEMRDNSCLGGEDLCDYSGNGNHASFEATSNHVWQEEEMCYLDGCLSLDGSPGSANTTDTNTLDFGTGSFTVQAWVRHSSISGPDVILIKEEGTGADGGYELRVETDGDYSFRITDNATDGKDQAITSFNSDYFHDEQWHLVTGVKNGTSNIELYIDGILAARDTFLSSTATLSNDDKLYIGQQGDGTRYWTGDIDEVKIFPYARSASEIYTDYTRAANIHGVSATFGYSPPQVNLTHGLIAYYRLNEVGTTAPVDESNMGSTGLSRFGGPVMTNAKFGNGSDLESSTAPNEMYFSRANNNRYAVTGNLTLSAWINPESNTAATQYDIAGKWDTASAQESYMFAQYGDELRLYVDSASIYAETVNANLATGTWYMVTGVYNAGNQSMQIYVNDVQQKVTITGTIPSSLTVETSRIYIGAQDYDGVTATTAINGYDGIIDEVRFYKTAWSADQVKFLYSFAPSPQGWWKMDENNGTTAYDVSGNAFNGTLANGPQWVPGKYGSGITFDGASGMQQDDVINTTMTSNLTALSVEAWIFPKSLGEGSAARIAAETDWRLIMAATSTLEFQFDFSGGSGQWIIPSNSLTFNTWQHVAVTYDGSSATNDPSIYVNGAKKTLATDANSSGTANTNTANVTIGNNSTGTRTFDGMIDDVRIYNYTRSPSQIVEDMNAGHPAPGSPVGSPHNWWKLDEGTGTTVYDSGAGNITGLLSSPATWQLDGKYGGSVFFNGSISGNDSHIDLPENIYDTFSEGSISFWFRALDTGDTFQDMFASNDATWAYYLEIGYQTTNNTVRVDTHCAAGCTTADIDMTIPLNNPSIWHHLVYTVGTGGNALYIDGQKQPVTYSQGGPGDTVFFDDLSPGSTNYNALGCTSSDGTTCLSTEMFEGFLDEVKVFNLALTADQVLLEYNRGSGIVMGALSTQPDGLTATNSAAVEFCVPGDSSICRPPVGWWKLDEGTGTTANDSSGRNNNGTIASNVKWAIGRNGPGLELSDSMTQQNIQVADNALWNFADGQNFTIEGWFNKKAGNTTENLITHRDSTTSACGPAEFSGWLIWIGGSTPDLNFRVCDETSKDVYNIDTVKLFPGDDGWHHFAVVWDDATENKSGFYADGIFDTAGRPATFASIGNMTGNFPLCFGNQPSNTTNCTASSGGQAAHAILDDFRIYDYARTPAQVAWSYNRGEPSILYKFDECQGATAYNAIRTSYNQPPVQNGTITIGATGSNNATGTCTGNSTDAWKNGAIGKRNASIDLDGDDKVDAGDSNDVEFEDQQDFSLAFWINPSLNGTGTIVAKKNGTGSTVTGYLITVNATGGLDFYISDSVDGYQVTKTGAVSANTWTHVVAVYDEDSTVNTDFYINTVKQNSAQTGSLSAIGNIGVNSTPLMIGAESDSTAGTFYDGMIDDFRLYQYALNQTQIRTLYNENSAVRFGPATGSP